MKLPRVPAESLGALVSLALVRLVIVLSGLGALAFFDIHHRGRLALLLSVVALPWASTSYFLTRSSHPAALWAWLPAIDLLVLALAQFLVPDSYAAVRFFALVLVVAHAHTHGERGGVAFAVAAVLVLVPGTLAIGKPLGGGTLAFYETIFSVSALGVAVFVGRLRAAEWTGRLRARELSRRAIEAENRVRRRVAESIHDNPIQELVSLDMMLEAAKRAVRRHEAPRAEKMLEEAHRLTERNIRALRDEILGLGPFAFDELGLSAALEQCAPVWSRRYGIEVDLSLTDVSLPFELCDALFGITQEAVANAGRHAEPTTVSVSLSASAQAVELRVRDDGHGFRGGPPLGAHEAGHIGLATMRERAELVGGALEIDTNGDGTLVLARVPRAQPAQASAKPDLPRLRPR